MIYGETNEKRWERYDQKRRKQYNGRWHFAWFPVYLRGDGRTAWLEWVWKRRADNFYSFGWTWDYFQEMPDSFEDRTKYSGPNTKTEDLDAV